MSSDLVIDADLARRLVAAQFPQWVHPITPVAVDGCDNRNFHLGERLRLRLPSDACYSHQIEHDRKLLPLLAPALPFVIPSQVAIGKPGLGYPWNWGVYEWIDGVTASPRAISDPRAFAKSLARFLRALQRIGVQEGPQPGPQNFFRGGRIAVYDDQARNAITRLAGQIDGKRALATWERALAGVWNGSPVWVHGDFSAGNLLVRGGELVAVIDFGQTAIGDPACDLAIAWTLLDSESREIFRDEVALDAQTWERGRGWALWKAAIVTAGMVATNQIELAQSQRTLHEIMNASLCQG